MFIPNLLPRAKGIVTRLRMDDRGSALLQSRPVSARQYLVAKDDSSGPDGLDSVDDDVRREVQVLVCHRVERANSALVPARTPRRYSAHQRSLLSTFSMMRISEPRPLT